MSNLTDPRMSKLSVKSREKARNRQRTLSTAGCLMIVSGLIGCRTTPASDAPLGEPMAAEEGRSLTMTETKPPTIPPANLAATNSSTASGTPTPLQPASDPAALTLTLEDAEQIKRALLESLAQSVLADREELLRVTRNVEPSSGTGLMRIGGWLLQPNAAAGSASVSLTYRGPVYGDVAQLYTSTAIRESGFWRVNPVKSGEVRRR